jgi:hypothetical protein
LCLYFQYFPLFLFDLLGLYYLFCQLSRCFLYRQLGLSCLLGLFDLSYQCFLYRQLGLSFLLGL